MSVESFILGYVFGGALAVLLVCVALWFLGRRRKC